MNKISIKHRIYPTKEQEQLLAKSFGCVRFVYNKILHWRLENYKNEKKSTSYNEASAQICKLKAEFPWLAEVPYVPLQQAIRYQQVALVGFFKKRTKYPVFKKKSTKGSICLTRSAFRFKEGQLYICKSKQPVIVRWSRELPSEPSSISISKDSAGRYFVSMVCEFQPKPLPVISKTIGIDVGLESLLITSDGLKIDNPRHFKRREKKLAFLQRQLNRKQKGGKNRNRARLKVARLYAKMVDCRKDNLHKLSRKIINENQVIVIESLKIANLMKNHKLAKHISDASWQEFFRQLEYKAKWAGRKIIKIDTFCPSSKTCSSCGLVQEKLPLSVRSWTCSACGVKHDRDINAACNIKTVGSAGLAFGATGTGA